ncbi:hypothetical protein [Ruania alba]|uniref:Uncharacterized protein n=1 Tax=Ruania alba TaxID=648782 RepID=A0A1H5BV94_9MICO|nr:hypothetical protein [Ruania alba]SED57960.1 hypothetical protein SAMN04488554_0193 [Ruania alba]
MTTIDARDGTDPRPVRDSLLPAALSLIAALAVLSGLAAVAGFAVRAAVGFFAG